MGRVARNGLDYFSVDTSWETNMRLVKAKYGLEGIGFMIELYASIYHDGYYRKWDDENEILFADEIRKPVEWVREVVEYCFDKKLFDRKIHAKHGVLTSHGIQFRYFKISRNLNRKTPEIIDGVTYPDIIENLSSEDNGFSSEDKRIPSEDKGISSAGKDHKAKQANSIKDNASKHAERDPHADDGFGPLPAAISITTDGIRNAVQLAPFQIRLSDRDLEDIAVHLNTKGLDQQFIAYVIRRAQEDAKKPGAFARSALLGEGALASMAEEYGAQKPPKPTQPDRDPPPRTCDTCDVDLRPSGDIVACPKCGAFWEYSTAWETWEKSSEKVVALDQLKGIREGLKKGGSG